MNGMIPSELGLLTNLHTLHLSSNNWIGDDNTTATKEGPFVPTELYQLTSLVNFTI